MSFGSSEMYTALNVSNITDLLDTKPSGSTAIYDDVLVAQNFIGEKSINYYLTFPEQFSEVSIYNYLINCRALTMGESRTIAQAVIDNINRVTASGYFIYCEIQGTIPPTSPDIDNYNTPVAARIKLK